MFTPKKHIFFIGPRKTATTSIYEVLSNHNVRMPMDIKETSFFDRRDVQLNTYEAMHGINPVTPFVEVSPSYFTNVNAVTNLSEYFPQAWIVITLRDPVDRAISAILHAERIGLLTRSDLSDHKALSENKHLLRILRTSNYDEYIGIWAQAFPRQTIVMRQSESGNIDKEVFGRTIETCGLPIDNEALSETHANSARRSRSPRITRFATRGMRRLDELGLSGARKYLKPLGRALYGGSPKLDDDLTQKLEVLLREPRARYQALPKWVHM